MKYLHINWINHSFYLIIIQDAKKQEVGSWKTLSDTSRF